MRASSTRIRRRLASISSPIERAASAPDASPLPSRSSPTSPGLRDTSRSSLKPRCRSRSTTTSAACWSDPRAETEPGSRAPDGQDIEVEPVPPRITVLVSSRSDMFLLPSPRHSLPTRRRGGTRVGRMYDLLCRRRLNNHPPLLVENAPPLGGGGGVRGAVEPGLIVVDRDWGKGCVGRGAVGGAASGAFRSGRVDQGALAPARSGSRDGAACVAFGESAAL